MKKIAITTDAIRANPDGIGIVARHWIRSLQESGVKIELWDYCFSPELDNLALSQREFSNFWPYFRAGLWNASLPFQARKMLPSYESLLYLSGLPPVLGPLEKCVLAVYDLIDLKFPHIQRLGRIKKWYLQCVLPRALRRAKRIVTISSTTANDLVTLLNVPEARIHKVPLGPSFGDLHPQISDEQIQTSRSKFGLNRPFILMVGTIHPRKNHLTALKVLKKLLEKSVDVELVIVGQGGWKGEEFRRYLSSSSLENRVKMLGYVPNESLWALYRSAELLLYPSVYEGFGLPVLDAMILGCPVVTSKDSPMAELGCSSVVVVEPENVESVSRGVVSILANPSFRDELSGRGMERARTFTWKRSAEALFEAIT